MISSIGCLLIARLRDNVDGGAKSVRCYIVVSPARYIALTLGKDHRKVISGVEHIHATIFTLNIGGTLELIVKHDWVRSHTIVICALERTCRVYLILIIHSLRSLGELAVDMKVYWVRLMKVDRLGSLCIAYLLRLYLCKEILDPAPSHASILQFLHQALLILVPITFSHRGRTETMLSLIFLLVRSYPVQLIIAVHHKPM